MHSRRTQSLSIARPSVRSRAFTFAEVLAAMVFIGVLIPVAVQALRVSNRAAAMAARKRVAARLASTVLSEAIVTEEWRDGNREGDFGEDYPAYRWALTTDAWEDSTMRQVSVEVLFLVQGSEHRVRLSTLAAEAVLEAEE